MDIREALEAALVEVTAAIPDAKAEAEKAAQHVAALLDEERGLQLALARRTVPAADSSTTTRTVGTDAVLVPPPPEPEASTEPTGPEVAPAEPRSDWASLNHMDAVLRALTEANRPLSPKDIVRALRAVGRSDSNDQARAALAALKRHGRVSLIGRAQWVAIADDGGSAGLKALPTATHLSRLDEARIFQPPGSNGLASLPMDEGKASESAKV